ncbi:LOW QUALITY PROTEIN: VPS10 domain-containing receptor SorCS1-like [Chanos chanos]|uniref:LOW QUALITY PROTEIN: VPS10 domain-containing receptor SorCS1-like n=1 Tax=Chanos chanos TaxID=29144 RepID=A0A6J2WCT8_CHACN|nr:LOW QUALITY PROTEIN: VPS10 domain-containing receptor SorCS1-like [Chanos chanos]
MTRYTRNWPFSHGALWIWLVTLTAILGVSGAEIQCIPSCPVLSSLSGIRGPRLHTTTDLSETGKKIEDYGTEMSRYDVDSQTGELLDNMDNDSDINDSFSPEPPSEHYPTGTSFNLDVTSSGLGELVPGTVEQQESQATASTQDEFKLNSSIFALTGDSAHNQAMVHWSGQNSSVILMLTKYFDFSLGSVTESSLWRSTDYGTTYEKLNEKVGSRTILSYLYVSPNNKRKIMLLTDPEVESSLLISLDEGASYQKFPLSFVIHSLLFHPEQEDWILAYSHEQKLYVSVEFGRSWQLVHDRVVPNRFYWSKLGLDREPGLIHLETSVSDTRSLYITCRLQNCSEVNRGQPFPGYISPNSLVVQDEYVFIQVPTQGRPVHYVSYKRHHFAPIKLPKYTLAKDLQVISTDDGQVVAAVQDWQQNDSYHLFMSDARGVLYTLALENVVCSRGSEGNIMIDLYEVTGIKGVFLANRILDDQVKTYITFNKGRDWRLLQAPSRDLRGNQVHCVLPSCSLHLHLHVSDNPYTSGNIVSKESAPGVILASGNIGSELSTTNVSIFITSDAGNTWREIFDEEYSVLFLNQGGALVAIRHTPLPIRHLWLSFDEGRQWSKYSFSSSPLYVDGVLGEPGEGTLVMTIFGHFSYRSEWQVVKVDFRSIFSRSCSAEDYQQWRLLDNGQECIMGVKRTYRKLRPNSRCMKGKDSATILLTAESCPCTEADFECDYGYERQIDGRCAPAFWFTPISDSPGCTKGRSMLSRTGFRRAISNNCSAGHVTDFSTLTHICPTQRPRGLQLLTGAGSLRASLGTNVTFLLFLDEGDSSSTTLTVDFGDGIANSYSNFSSVGDGVKHVYNRVGIYKVSAVATNSLGSDRTSIYLHVTCELKQVYLSAPFVVMKNKGVNLTAVLQPTNVGTVSYYWWLGNTTEPRVTLEGGFSYTFSQEGVHAITVQVSAGSAVLQDSRTISVHEYFRSHPLVFSSNLDPLNPELREWGRDISRVIKTSIVQATGISEEQLLVAVLPGLPTEGEFYIVPDKRPTDRTLHGREAHVDQLFELILNALNQDLIQFTLSPGVQVNVYAARLSPAPLVDGGLGRHSGSALLMLLAVVLLGLAVFIIYKYKRKIPGLNVYASERAEREQEVISTVSTLSIPSNTVPELDPTLVLHEPQTKPQPPHPTGYQLACSNSRSDVESHCC